MFNLFAFFTPGPMELCIAAGVAILLFGPTMVPKMARSLGSIIPEFKRGLKEVQEIQEVVKDARDEVVGEINDVKTEVKKTVGVG